jgi:hypothetical protein
MDDNIIDVFIKIPFQSATTEHNSQPQNISQSTDIVLDNNGSRPRPIVHLPNASPTNSSDQQMPKTATPVPPTYTAVPPNDDAPESWLKFRLQVKYGEVLRPLIFSVSKIHDYVVFVLNYISYLRTGRKVHTV